MATQAERIKALETENAEQKAQIAVLEAKLILVLDYLDQRVVDRLNKVEFDLNRVAFGAAKLHDIAQVTNDPDQKEALLRLAHPISFIRDSINTALPFEYPMPPRTELEAQIVSPPTITPASEEA